MKLVSTSELNSRSKDVTVFWGHRMAVTDATALAEALRASMISINGVSDKAAWTARGADAIDALVTKHATTIRGLIRSAWRTNSISGAATVQPKTRTIDGVYYLVDHPSLSSPFYHTAENPVQTTYRLAAVSLPNAAYNAKCYGLTESTWFVTPLSSLLTLKVQLLGVPDSSSSDVSQVKAKIEDQYNGLLSSTHILDLLSPIDFVSIENGRIVVPRSPLALAAAMGGGSAVTPAQTDTAVRLQAYRQVASGWRTLAAEVHGLTGSEANQIAAMSEFSLDLASDNAWIQLPAAATSTVELTSGETEILLQHPELLLGMIPRVLRRTDGDTAFTPLGYASTIYRLSQSIAVLRGTKAFVNNWTAAPADAPDSLVDYVRRVRARDGQQPITMTPSAWMLLDAALGDAKISYASPIDMVPCIARALRLVSVQPCLTQRAMRDALRGLLSTADVSSVEWDANHNALVFVTPQATVTVTMQVSRVRGDAREGEDLAAAWKAAGEADATEAWAMALHVSRVAHLLMSAQTLNKVDVVPSSGHVRYLYPVRVALASQLPAIASGHDYMISPFIYNRDAGDDREVAHG